MSTLVFANYNIMILLITALSLERDSIQIKCRSKNIRSVSVSFQFDLIQFEVKHVSLFLKILKSSEAFISFFFTWLMSCGRTFLDSP